MLSTILSRSRSNFSRASRARLPSCSAMPISSRRAFSRFCLPSSSIARMLPLRGSGRKSVLVDVDLVPDFHEKRLDVLPSPASQSCSDSWHVQARSERRGHLVRLLQAGTEGLVPDRWTLAAGVEAFLRDHVQHVHVRQDLHELHFSEPEVSRRHDEFLIGPAREALEKEIQFSEVVPRAVMPLGLRPSPRNGEYEAAPPTA